MRKLLILAIVSLSGCCTYSTGFDRGALLATLEKQGPLQVTEEDIQKALELREQLSFPCKVAIYLYEPDNREWRWSSKDKEFVMQWMDALKQEGLVSDAFFISGMFAKGTSMKELRLSAAQHGADAVTVVKAASETDAYVNAAAVLNLTLVGGYVIPASHRDALFLIQSGLVDVANGFLYATIQSEGEGSIMAPTFTVQDKDAIDLAKKQALDNLGPELLRRLRNLRSNGGRPTVHFNQPIPGNESPPPRLASPVPGSN